MNGRNSTMLTFARFTIMLAVLHTSWIYVP